MTKSDYCEECGCEDVGTPDYDCEHECHVILKCDHIIGLSEFGPYAGDQVISVRDNTEPEYSFKYCPECGDKL